MLSQFNHISKEVRHKQRHIKERRENKQPYEAEDEERMTSIKIAKAFNQDALKRKVIDQSCPERSPSPLNEDVRREIKCTMIQHPEFEQFNNLLSLI